MKWAATMFSVPLCIAFGGRIRSGYMGNSRKNEHHEIK